MVLCDNVIERRKIQKVKNITFFVLLIYSLILPDYILGINHEENINQSPNITGKKNLVSALKYENIPILNNDDLVRARPHILDKSIEAMTQKTNPFKGIFPIYTLLKPFI